MLKRIFFFLFLAAPAFAQPQPITVSPALAQHLDAYLLQGGTHAEGQGLSRELHEAFEGPIRLQRAIDDAVARAKKAPDEK